MAKKTKVPIAIVKRLPRYYRYLSDLLSKGVKRISSKELSERMGVTASQIRQDLNIFGGFGQQGYGYSVEELLNEITNIMGLNKNYNTIIIGSGNLGQAIANYTNFENWGFKLKAMFDVNPKLIGVKIRGIEILDVDMLGDFVKKNTIDIVILTLPKEKVQDIVDLLIELKIKAFWNFSATDIDVPDDVIVESVHLSDSLFTVSYKLNEDALFDLK